jgi:hypothetical protein
MGLGRETFQALIGPLWFWNESKGQGYQKF